MDHWEKIRRMETHLSSMGLKSLDYAPPAYRLLWRLGVKITPPLFASFWHLALVPGVLFAFGWGTFMSMLAASRQVPPVSGWRFLTFCVIAGALFGAFLARPAYQKIRTLGLPRWAEYRGGPGS
ncbi:DUF6404 family protein [Tahibacter amnicola]|uniref:DUF6404 family protein n=1 Tax=Tahibacter amnicola TaxID=2976241 RepID=A0ABY6B946_9GAMM|nr:DUF6404 family protein [Tahibacter amnicola]UXI66588.1 DUF6404 family protein [Tahibacter amnicola]